jgi:hypothetical protein
MDIIGPVRQSLSVSHNHPNCIIKSTDKQVPCFEVSTSHPIMKLVEYYNKLSLLLWSLKLQGKKVNLFQPAAEFLPMINEVHICEVLLRIIFQYSFIIGTIYILIDSCLRRCLSLLLSVQKTSKDQKLRTINFVYLYITAM